MRILILSCNTGGGHNACAGALQEAFSSHGCQCDIADALHFISDKVSKIVSWGHTTMYRHAPGLFRVGYDIAEKRPGILHDDAAAFKLLSSGTEQLYAYIRDGNYDVVVCAHIFSGIMLGQMLKEHPLSLKTGVIATDYTCSPGFAQCELDRYFIPAPSLCDSFIAQGVPSEKIVASGIPIRTQFYAPADRQKAKQALGIQPEQTHLLMMCGSMGCGPLEKLTHLLTRDMDPSMVLTIVCGTNEKLREELMAGYGNIPNLHIYGFVKDMPALLDSADLCLTKPGGLSTTEAAAKCLPMVFIDAVAGCEEYNLHYFTALGGAITGNTPEESAQLCIELLRNTQRRSAMADALAALPKINSAQCIYDTMCSLT